jgi:hypothetical protein
MSEMQNGGKPGLKRNKAVPSRARADAGRGGASPNQPITSCDARAYACNLSIEFYYVDTMVSI